MGRLLGLDLAVWADAAQPGLEDIAHDIAAGARAGYQQSDLRTDDPKTGVIVESGPDGVKVVTYNSFAHFDEWGGSGVRSTPTGAMRAAAARAGTFREDGK